MSMVNKKIEEKVFGSRDGLHYLFPLVEYTPNPEDLEMIRRIENLKQIQDLESLAKLERKLAALTSAWKEGWDLTTLKKDYTHMTSLLSLIQKRRIEIIEEKSPFTDLMINGDRQKKLF